MGEKRKLDFFVLRYAPDAVKGEFVNFGLVGVEEDGSFHDVRLTRDWRRLQCFDPGADMEWLSSMEGELRQGLAGDRASLMKRVEESFSNAVQMSEWKGCLTEDPVKEMDLLSGIYLEQHRPARTGMGARQRIYRELKDAFEVAGVWNLGMPGMTVSKYTWEQDPLKIDFGYQAGGVVKMFQAVTLKASLDPALALAFRYPKIAAGMARENLEAQLTAVVEDPREIGETAAMALKAMRESGLAVRGTAELGSLAEEARRELHA